MSHFNSSPPPPPQQTIPMPSVPPSSPIRSPNKYEYDNIEEMLLPSSATASTQQFLSDALSPTSEVAFDRVLKSVASKVWNDEKDAVLLQELESVLDPKTYKAIVTPFHDTNNTNNNNSRRKRETNNNNNNNKRYPNLRHISSTSLPINEDDDDDDDEVVLTASSNAWQSTPVEEEEEEEENIFEKEQPDVNISTTLNSEPGIVLVDDSAIISKRTSEEDKYRFWGESFDSQLNHGNANVPVTGSRAAMLVGLKREVEEEEDDAKQIENNNNNNTDDDDDTEDEWDDDDDEGYIAQKMSLQEFLCMETSNIEALNENQNKNNASSRNINIRPSVVWIRGRENELEETYFSHEMEQDDGRDFDDDADDFEGDGHDKKNKVDGTVDYNGNNNNNNNIPRDDDDNNNNLGSPSKLSINTGSSTQDANNNEDIFNNTNGSRISNKNLYVDGGFLDTSADNANQINNISDDEEDEDHGIEYEAFNLKIVHERHKTGFEADKDLKLHEGYCVAGRYIIESMVGEASFSTAWKAIDKYPNKKKANNKIHNSSNSNNNSKKNRKRVCLKVIKNNKDFLDQSLDEIKLLRYLNAAGDVDKHHILRLYDYFYFKEHLFISTELLRDNLYEFSRYNRESGDTIYFNLRRIRSVAQQCLEALDYMHSLGLIHCDLKPENVLIQSYSNCQIKVIDFGSSCYITDHLTSYIQSRSYRAPEVLLGCTYGQKIDVWSLGCILAELWTGNVLFHNHSVASLLSRIIAIIGPFPKLMLAEGVNVPKYFTASNRLYESSYDVEVESDTEEDESNSNNANSEQKVEEYILLYPKKTSLKHRLRVNYEKFIDFMENLLQIDPNKRMSTRQALQHPFLN